MNTHRIKVYDYDGSRFGSMPWHKQMYLDKEPHAFEVDAWCLGGEEGFRAWFIVDGTLYEAHGDDGHWWLVSTMSTHWIAKLKETVASIEEPK